MTFKRKPAPKSQDDAIQRITIRDERFIPPQDWPGYWLQQGDKVRLLGSLLSALAGNVVVGAEGRLQGLGLVALTCAKPGELGLLVRNTAFPILDYLVLPVGGGQSGSGGVTSFWDPR